MKRALQLMAGLVLLLTLAGCHAPAEQGDVSASMELKIYNVPPAQMDGLSKALASALGQSDLNQVLDHTSGQKSRVSVVPPDKLLVYAPQSVQASISDAITALGSNVSVRTAPAQIRLQFWVVDGRAGTGEDDPSLKDLITGLASLRQTMGPLHFHLDQTASAVVSSDRDGAMTTNSDGGLQMFNFNVGVIQNDTVDLKLSYQNDRPPNQPSSLGTLLTRISAGFGQYIVLAQAPGVGCPTSATGKDAPPCPTPSAVRMLVVRVDRLNPHS